MQQLQVNFSLKSQVTVDKLVNYIAEFPQATFATTTLGKYDVAVEFIVKNTKEMRGLLNKIKENFSDQIVNYDIFIMEEHSINWFPLVNPQVNETPNRRKLRGIYPVGNKNKDRKGPNDLSKSRRLFLVALSSSTPHEEEVQGA